MILSLLILSCLVDHDTFNQRRLELSDDDGDGFAEVDGDCNDADPTVNPVAVEICDDIDNDCDKLIDDADSDLSLAGWYHDDDGDGFGADAATGTCAGQSEWVQNNTDCDDGFEEVSPAEAEVCNDGVDNDCSADPAECRRTDEARASGSDGIVHPPTRVDSFGTTFLGTGDLDADGFDDFAVSASGRSEDSVHFVSGIEAVGTLDLDTIDLSIDWPDSMPDSFGESIGIAERTSVFGEPALVVGSDSRAYWYSIPVSDSLDAAEADGSISVGAGLVGVTSHYGPSAAIDSDLDGLAELVTVRIDSDYSGEVSILDSRVWEGGSFERPAVSMSTVHFEGSVATSISAVAGDQTGDGVAEFCVSAPLWSDDEGSTGAVFIIDLTELPSDSHVSDIGSIVRGSHAGDSFGLGGCRSIGDADNDGYADLLVGSPLTGEGGSAKGAAFLFRGPISAESASSAVLRIDGDTTGDMFGLVMSAVGDFDGDDSADIVIGAPQQPLDGAGYVSVLYGPFETGTMSASDADWRIVGDRDGDHIGAASFVGDINGDGRSDLLATSTTANDNAGAAYLFLGSGI